MAGWRVERFEGACERAKALTSFRLLPTPLPAADDVEGCLVTRDAGKAGGPMDVLVLAAPPTEGRGLVPTEETLAFDSVPVRELVALDAAFVASCFVGDFVGDYNIACLSAFCLSSRPATGPNANMLTLLSPMLDGRPGLGTGLGLGAFKLIRLPKAGSVIEVGRPGPAGPPTLLAREVLRAGAAAFGGAACKIVTAAGRTNMPLPIAQSKYRSP